MVDLQEDVAVKDDKVSGTLKYISTGWDPGTWSEADATGNYVVLHFEVPDVEGVTIKVSNKTTSTLDEDGIYVGRIADKNSQTLTVVASKEGYADVVKVLYLHDLVCESA